MGWKSQTQGFRRTKHGDKRRYLTWFRLKRCGSDSLAGEDCQERRERLDSCKILLEAAMKAREWQSIWPFPPWPLKQNQGEPLDSQPLLEHRLPNGGSTRQKVILSESSSLLGTMFLINVPDSRVWVLFMLLEAYGRTNCHTLTTLSFLQYFVSSAHQSWGWQEEQSWREKCYCFPRELVRLRLFWSRGWRLDALRLSLGFTFLFPLLLIQI